MSTHTQPGHHIIFKHMYICDVCLVGRVTDPVSLSLSLSADFELAQLQDRLNETKDVIERIISAASASSDRCGYRCVCLCVSM